MHSIYTHTIRVWQTVDPLRFIEIYNNDSYTEQNQELVIIEEFYLNVKDILMGTTLTYLAYYLTLTSHQNSTKISSK